VELVDTGGYGFVDPDQLTEHIRHQIEMAMTRADLVLFVVDGQDGLTTADQEIASLLRRKGIRTVLVANKVDGERLDAVAADFARLGLGTPIGVSAKNVRNMDEVVEKIRQNVNLDEAPTELTDPEMMVAIVGKRNAGKSTLVNAIAEIYEGEGDRVIVSEVPGTTRDSIDVRISKEGQPLVVIDTAGVRKKRHMVTNDIEFYSFHRAQRSVRRADVVMLLIDATVPISEPDKKLAQYIHEQLKPVLMVINKWDLARDELRAKKKFGEEVDERVIMHKYREYLDEELKNIEYAPIVFMTAKDGKNVPAAVDMAQHLFKQARLRLSTGRLNTAIREILQERQPSTPSGRKAKVFYVTQVDVCPPTIVLVVNNPAYFDEQYQRFLISRMRDLLPYPEVPIKLLFRPRGQRNQGKSLEELSDEQTGEVAEGAAEQEKDREATPVLAAGLVRGKQLRKPARRPKRKNPRKRVGQSG
jgi:GTP-binding protein